jgi:hypothetical protein
LWRSNANSGNGARVSRGEQSRGFMRDNLASSFGHGNVGKTWAEQNQGEVGNPWEAAVGFSVLARVRCWRNWLTSGHWRGLGLVQARVASVQIW